MQPVYDTVHSLLVEINQGVSRYTPSNISTAGTCVGMPWAHILTEASRFIGPKATLALPDLCWLPQGAFMQALGRQEEVLKARAAPELAQHPRRQDQVEGPHVSQPTPGLRSAQCPSPLSSSGRWVPPSWQDFPSSARLLRRNQNNISAHFP